MNRRDALKRFSAMTLALPVVAAVSHTATAATAPLYRGTRDGRVLESLDRGRTWQTVANFGSHLAVTWIGVVDGKLQVQLTLASGESFMLTSSDARKWYTLQTSTLRLR
jgi:hypothetical protein